MTYSKDLTRRTFLERTLVAGLAGFAGTRLAIDSATAGASESKQKGWQIGCWSRPWAKYDYRVGMDAVAEAGYKYMGLTGAKTRTGRVIAPDTTIAEAERVGEEAKQRGLQITFVYGGGLPLHKGNGSLMKMIDNCAAAGGQSVIVAHLGNQKTRDVYCQAIKECCDYAAEKKVAVKVKPHGGMTGTGPLCREALKRIGHENCSLVYDPGNIYYYSDGEVNPVGDAATVAELVTGMSVKDYKHPKQVMLTPGTGQVDFPALMARLQAGGFTHGPLIVETFDPGDLPHTLKEAKKTRGFLEELVGQS